MQQQARGVGADVQTLGTLQRINAIDVQQMMDVQPAIDERHQLLYVTVIVNGRPVRAMVDSGATHNFITPAKARECGLKVEVDNDSVMKAVNCPAQRVGKRACNVPISVGDVTHKTEFSVVKMDNFDIALGQTWLRTAKIMISSYSEQLLMVGGEKIRVVEAAT
eukprot:c25270_g3_i2 orf=1629-2120(+)